MNATCTAVHGDIIRGYKQAVYVEERVLCRHIFKIRTFEVLNNAVIGNTACRHGLVHKRFSDNVHFFARFNKDITLIRIERYRTVSGKCPCGGRPNNEVHFGEVAVRGKFALIVFYREFNIYRRAVVVRIFDFCLCKCGLIDGTPINGLKSLVDVAFFIHLAEHFDFNGLKSGIHRRIRMFPIAENAETLELFHLNVNEIVRKLMTSVSELGNRHLFSVQFIFFDYCAFDRHTVVIPTGDIRSLKAADRLITDYKVFQNLVHRRPHVNVSVRERRTVMKNVLRSARVFLLKFFVSLLSLPFFEKSRLALRKSRSHREIGLRQVQCLIIIHR